MFGASEKMVLILTIAIFTVLVLAEGAVGYFVVWQKREELLAEKDGLNKQINRLRKEVEKIPELKKQIREMEPLAIQKAEELPIRYFEKDLSDFIEQVSGFAQEAGIRWLNCDPGMLRAKTRDEGRQRRGYDQDSFELDIEGQFFNVCQFFFLLETKGPWLLRLDDFELRQATLVYRTLRGEEIKFPGVTGTCGVTAYYFVGED